MSARQEKVRAILAGRTSRRYAAALAEVEEWEARLAEAERRADWLYRDADEKHGQIKAAEAERDRLAGALRKIQAAHVSDTHGSWDAEIARAALAGEATTLGVTSHWDVSSPERKRRAALAAEGATT